MPTKPKQICREPHCHKKVNGSYCKDHKKSKWGKTDPWYNKPIWCGNPHKPLGQRGGLREAQLMRQPYCEQCKHEGTINDVTKKGKGHVDHIIPFRSVPKEQQWNMFVDQKNHRTLCRSHHMSKTGKNE